MENSENLENIENPENKKEIVPVDKEESISLKENNEITKEKKKKKKSKKISLEKVNLGTKPINISSSDDLINFNYIYYFMKSRIRFIFYILIGIIVFFILLTLKGVFHDETEEEKKQIVQNKNIPTPPQNPNPITPVAPGESPIKTRKKLKKFKKLRKKRKKRKYKDDDDDEDDDDN